MAFVYQNISLPSGIDLVVGSPMGSPGVDTAWFKEMEIHGGFDFGNNAGVGEVTVMDNLGVVRTIRLSYPQIYPPLSFTLNPYWKMSDTMEVGETIEPTLPINGGAWGGAGNYKFSFKVESDNPITRLNSGFIIDENTGVISGTPNYQALDYGSFTVILSDYSASGQLIDSIEIALERGVIVPKFEWNLPTDFSISDSLHQGFPSGSILEPQDIGRYVSGGLPFETKNSQPYLFSSINLEPDFSVDATGFLRGTCKAANATREGYFLATDARGKTIKSRAVTIEKINGRIHLENEPIDGFFPDFRNNYHWGGHISDVMLLSNIVGGTRRREADTSDSLYVRLNRTQIPNGVKITISGPTIVNPGSGDVPTKGVFTRITADEYNPSLETEWMRFLSDSTRPLWITLESDNEYLNYEATVDLIFGDRTSASGNFSPQVTTYKLKFGPFCSSMYFFTPSGDPTPNNYIDKPVKNITLPEIPQGYNSVTMTNKFLKIKGGLPPYSITVTNNDSIYPFKLEQNEAAEQNPSFFFLSGSYGPQDVSRVGAIRYEIRDKTGEVISGEIKLNGGAAAPGFFANNKASLENFNILGGKATLNGSLVAVLKGTTQTSAQPLTSADGSVTPTNLDTSALLYFDSTPGRVKIATSGSPAARVSPLELRDAIKVGGKSLIGGSFKGPKVTILPTWRATDTDLTPGQYKIGLLSTNVAYTGKTIISLPSWGKFIEHKYIDPSTDTSSRDIPGITIYYYSSDNSEWPKDSSGNPAFQLSSNGYLSGTPTAIYPPNSALKIKIRFWGETKTISDGFQSSIIKTAGNLGYQDTAEALFSFDGIVGGRLRFDWNGEGISPTLNVEGTEELTQFTSGGIPPYSYTIDNTTIPEGTTMAIISNDDGTRFLKYKFTKSVVASSDIKILCKDSAVPQSEAEDIVLFKPVYAELRYKGKNIIIESYNAASGGEPSPRPDPPVIAPFNSETLEGGSGTYTFSNGVYDSIEGRTTNIIPYIVKSATGEIMVESYFKEGDAWKDVSSVEGGLGKILITDQITGKSLEVPVTYGAIEGKVSWKGIPDQEGGFDGETLVIDLGNYLNATASQKASIAITVTEHPSGWTVNIQNHTKLNITPPSSGGEGGTIGLKLDLTQEETAFTVGGTTTHLIKKIPETGYRWAVGNRIQGGLVNSPNDNLLILAMANYDFDSYKPDSNDPNVLWFKVPINEICQGGLERQISITIPGAWDDTSEGGVRKEDCIEIVNGNGRENYPYFYFRFPSRVVNQNTNLNVTVTDILDPPLSPSQTKFTLVLYFGPITSA